MSDGVDYRVEGHVAHVTIDRPEVLNALDGKTTRRLEEVWQQVERSPDVYVVVLTGAGDRGFCVGSDMRVSDADKTGVDYWTEGSGNGFGALTLRTTLDTPIIARINGHALGGGLELALGCDILVASENATLGFTEPRVGRLPLDGGIATLSRRIPFHLAMGMLLTGRRVRAAEALSFGLLNEVVPAEQLDDAVQRWVDDVLACAPLSLRAIKHTARQLAHLSPREAHALRTPQLLAALRSEDGDEGQRAFLEKRAPQWTGR